MNRRHGAPPPAHVGALASRQPSCLCTHANIYRTTTHTCMQVHIGLLVWCSTSGDLLWAGSTRWHLDSHSLNYWSAVVNPRFCLSNRTIWTTTKFMYALHQPTHNDYNFEPNLGLGAHSLSLSMRTFNAAVPTQLTHSTPPGIHCSSVFSLDSQRRPAGARAHREGPLPGGIYIYIYIHTHYTYTCIVYMYYLSLYIYIYTHMYVCVYIYI